MSLARIGKATGIGKAPESGVATADLDFSMREKKDASGAENVKLPDPDGQAVSRLGDLWLIGPHRLYCRNARGVASYEALLGNERAAIVFDDPPYNVLIDGFFKGNGRNRHREFVMGKGELSPAEFTTFLRAIFRSCVRFSVDGSIQPESSAMRFSAARKLANPGL